MSKKSSFFVSSFDNFSPSTKLSTPVTNKEEANPATGLQSKLKSSTVKRKSAIVDTDSDASGDDCLLIDSRRTVSSCIDWLKHFEPKESTDLAVHPKKLEELRNWFKIQCVKFPNRILVIEGPTGSAKTTALRVVAKENGFDVLEWINPTDQEKDLLFENFQNLQNREFVSMENHIDKFSDFLQSASRCQSILKKNKKRILLVKDFPNQFLKKPEEFWKILANHSEEGDVPLVFILTDTQSKTLNLSYNMFPDKVRIDYSIDSINFNQVSVTMLKRGVKRILQMINNDANMKIIFKKPPDEFINNLIDDCSGDMRNLIQNISFASSEKTNFKLPVEKAKKSAKKKKKTDSGLGKLENLTLLHGVGRVLYPKLELNPETNLMELTHKPEDIAEAFSSQPGNVIRLLHSNYQKNFSCIDDTAQAAEMFSLGDCIESEYRDQQLSQVNLNFIIRSTMVLNKHPPPGFRPVSAYANKKWQKTEAASRERLATLGKIVNNGNLTAPADFYCDYNHFLKIIKNE